MTHAEKLLQSQTTPAHPEAIHYFKQLSANEQQNLLELRESIKESLTRLQERLDAKDIRTFYEWVGSLKFVIEYSDELNKNWYLIRAYSGALNRLLKEPTPETADLVCQYYEMKYGGRRILRHENLFEQQRWNFIDELKTIDNQASLDKFIAKRTKKLEQTYLAFQSEVLLFLKSLPNA